MSSWARSGWTSRGRDNRHDRERSSLHRSGTHAEPQVEPTLRGLLAQPKGVLQKNLKTFVYLGRGVARDRGGALQLHRQEDARAAGRRERAATAAHVAGQHRQQRAGLEEPASGRTPERAAGGNGHRCQDKIRRLPSATPAQQAAAAAYRPKRRAAPTSCGPGRPCGQAAARQPVQPQLTPEQQQAQLHRREGARTGRRLPLRFQSCVLPSGRATATAAAAPSQTMPAQYDHAERAGKDESRCPQRCRRTGRDTRRLQAASRSEHRFSHRPALSRLRRFGARHGA